VRGYIQKARSLDPDNASAFVAEAELLDPGKFAERLALIERALERNAAEPLLHAQHSSALFAVGRLTEAIGAAERAAALDPLSPNTQANLASALAHAGAVNRARRTLADAELQWPESEQIRATRFSIELRYGDPRIAQQMIDAGQASLGGPTGGFGGPEILMRARLNPTPENIERMVRFASAETRRAPQAVALRMQALGHAGAVDEFYNLLDQPGIVAHLQDATEVLFRPHIKAFRDDPRFLRLAAQLGLLHYWAASKRWPDFCSDPRLPYNCEQDGQRIFRGG
jgi:tetratricopeptide (TPR) repeat protein